MGNGEVTVFEAASELVRALAPSDLGDLRVTSHRRGLKLWFDTPKPTKEHYEAQLLARRYVDGGDGMALEIGFHAEHRDPADNDAVIDHIRSSEPRWRKVLGTPTEVATFFGAENWRRVSETWIEPDLEDPELGFEIAARLVDYVSVIEPARR